MPRCLDVRRRFRRRMFFFTFNDDGDEILIRCVFSALLCLQNRELQIMRRLEHCNIVKLKYFFYSSGEKVSG